MASKAKRSPEEMAADLPHATGVAAVAALGRPGPSAGEMLSRGLGLHREMARLEQQMQDTNSTDLQDRHDEAHRLAGECFDAVIADVVQRSRS